MTDIDRAARILAAQYIGQAAERMATKSADCKAGGYRAKANGCAHEFEQQLAYSGAFSCAEHELLEHARSLTGRCPTYRRPETRDAEPALFDLEEAS